MSQRKESAEQVSNSEWSLRKWKEALDNKRPDIAEHYKKLAEYWNNQEGKKQ